MAVNFHEFVNLIKTKTKFHTEQFIKNIKLSLSEISIDAKKNFKIPKNSNSFLDSDLITKNKDRKFIEINLFNNKLTNSTLLYKGTRDGFKNSKFKSLCVNKGPVLIIIKSEYKKIFGGFLNSLQINYNFKNYKGSFLFSLDYKEKYEMKKNQRFGARDEDNILSFGSDIWIDQNSCECSCEDSFDGLSFFGTNYIKPEIKDENDEYLAGFSEYKVIEMEVYSIELI